MSWEDRAIPLTEDATTPQGWEQRATPIVGYNDNQSPPQQQVQNVDPIGVGGGILQGMKDPVNGLAGLMLRYGPDYGGTGLDPLKTLNDQVALDENTYTAGRKAAGLDGIDWPRLGGSVAATAPEAALIPEVKAIQFAPYLTKGAAKIASFLGNTGVNAAAGGGFAAMQPVTSGTDYDQEKDDQVELGSGIGALLSPITHGLSRVIDPKNVSDHVKTLMNNGVSPTVGQLGIGSGLENLVSKVPILGSVVKGAQSRAVDQLNSAAINRALSPIGESTDNIGRKGIQDVSDKLGNAYDKILPNLSFKLDDGFSTAVTDARSQVPDSLKPRFDEIMKSQMSKLDGNSQASGDVLKGIQSEFSRHAAGYGSSISHDEGLLGDALDTVHGAFRENIKANNPTDAKRLADINRGYANYSILRRVGASDKSGEGFSPLQLANAVRSADKSVGKGNYARGTATMQDLSDAGTSILGNAYPGGKQSGSEIIAGLLGSAATEGGAAAIGHAVLPVGAGAAHALAYTPWGQKIAAQLFAGNRPAVAGTLADSLTKFTPALSNALGIMSSQGAN